VTNPCPGYGVSTPYGKPGSWSAGYHTGEDYACPTGTPIVASAAGKVVALNPWGSSYGTHVVIESSGVRHGYCHLSGVSVAVGAQVAEGQRIGTSGATGNVTGPHLHYEERTSPYGYNNVDRAPAFSKGGGGSSGGGGDYPTPSGKTVYLDKLRYGQTDSDSVWHLQNVLNGHTLDGGQTLPLTGNYLGETDEEVRLCQTQHGYGNDPAGGSYVGSKQAEHLFGGKGYTIT